LKVLWFTNVPILTGAGSQDLDRDTAGGWISSLLNELVQVPGIDLTVACVAPGVADQEAMLEKNCRLITIRQGPARRLFAYRDLDQNDCYLDACRRLTQMTSPDIIHVHGSERFYGLLGARNLVSPPLVISIQGIVSEYAKYRTFFGTTEFIEILRMHDIFHMIRGIGPFYSWIKMRRAACREQEIFKGNKWFMGRTAWDYAHLNIVNSRAKYYSIPEIMRPMFYEQEWNLDHCERQRIIFTNGDSSRRGLEVLIDALAALRSSFRKASLAIAGRLDGTPYGKILSRRIRALKLEEHVTFLGRLNQSQLINELIKSHVFAISSLCENSPNSLCEAHLVGMPCVASYVGGIPSLVDEERTGLLFPAGDAANLASSIGRIFGDNQLAVNLGAAARQAAMTRHNPRLIIRAVIKAYETIIAEARTSSVR
jgi:glycosyltransferase involved in cell wall biosynthesis